jgi:hypothetical protein
MMRSLSRQRPLSVDEFEPPAPGRRESDTHYEEDWRALSRPHIREDDTLAGRRNGRASSQRPTRA